MEHIENTWDTSIKHGSHLENMEYIKKTWITSRKHMTHYKENMKHIQKT